MRRTYQCKVCGESWQSKELNPKSKPKVCNNPHCASPHWQGIGFVEHMRMAVKAFWRAFTYEPHKRIKIPNGEIAEKME